MRRPNARLQASRRNPPTEMLSQGSPPPCPNRYECTFCRSNLATAATFFAAASGLCLFYFLSSLSSSHRFGVIIDGGSTGTRIHLFGYRIGWGGLPAIDLGLTASMKVVPGLSAFVDNPETAAESLKELLDFVKDRVPKDRWGVTEVRLMATGGLRLLDGGLAEGILNSCRSALRSSGFKFQDDWATVISGANEGLYAWIAANYALGTLGKAAQETIGIVELGGASAQITFVPSEPMPAEFSLVIKFGQFTYNLYSHSFLHLGQNMAYEYLHRLLSSRDFKASAEALLEGVYIDPCTPKGYLYNLEQLKVSADALNAKIDYDRLPHAFGNFSECRSAALMLLRKEKDRCSYKNCHIGSTFVPKLQGKFIATENFFHTSKFFGLGPSSFIADLMLAGEKFCEEDWSELRRKYSDLEEEDLLRYCFSSAYIVALLHDSLGIAMNDSRVVFANQVGQVPLDWPLGAFIMQITAEGGSHSDGITVIIKAILPRLLSVLTFFSILAFIGLSILKWWKPVLKLKNKI
ncbi:probable apyrase 6 [Dendrobium catenatum]|uniref:Putative apyrase 6 n=1 Tax=Dendrobium catenatum TaxID=906689 RepID=A0A2I0WDY9_9ASPA|nr:probable apyrase 6 [Dendrobium catenatum]PKU73865.1 putative apyrase 6 [Dendrobium catenatum]